jgi:hypothetical protein
LKSSLKTSGMILLIRMSPSSSATGWDSLNAEVHDIPKTVVEEN